MRYVVLILSLLFLFCNLQNLIAQTYDRTGKDHALFFAVSDYEEWGDLKGPVPNAKAIAKLLEDDYGFKTEVVENPTRSDILNKLAQYNNPDKYEDDSQLLIFFGGHGNLDHFNTGIFAPSNASKKDMEGVSYIAYNRISQIIDNFPCKHIVLLIDACYSGNVIQPFYGFRGSNFGKRKGDSEDNYIRAKFIEAHKGYTRFVLTSGDEERTPDPSRFAEGIITGLKNGYNKEGLLSIDQLYSNFLKDKNPQPQRGSFGKQSNGDFLFLKKKEIATPNYQSQLYTVSKQQADEFKRNNNYKAAIETYKKAIRYGTAAQQLECENQITDCNYLAAMQEGRQLLAKSDCQNAKLSFQKALNYKPNDVKALQQIIAADDCLEDKSNSKNEESTEKLTSGTVIKDLPWLEMVYVEGGTFNMGSKEGISDEQPIHEVQVGDYYIGKYEVTVFQFKQFIDATGYQTDAEKEGYSSIWNGSSWEKSEGVNWEYDTKGNKRLNNDYNHPVIHVSWNDAIAFCNWISEKMNLKYRLPTEAEWEYAARGGSKSKGYTYAGGNSLDEVAWNNTNSGSKTHPVGEKKTNELGIHDMSGNVWEWCSDWYENDYYGNSAKENPQGPENGDYRVLRGGSWDGNSYNCRVANRYRHNPNFRDKYDGFRLVRDS